MKVLDYLIILVVLIWFIAAICFIVRIKKQGKSICCGTCGSSSAGCNKCKQRSPNPSR